jgi:hypothetical protein
MGGNVRPASVLTLASALARAMPSTPTKLASVRQCDTRREPSNNERSCTMNRPLPDIVVLLLFVVALVSCGVLEESGRNVGGDALFAMAVVLLCSGSAAIRRFRRLEARIDELGVRIAAVTRRIEGE